MRCQPNATGLELTAQVGLEMTRYRDDNRLRILLQDPIDEGKLLLGSQGGLDHDDIVGAPYVRLCLVAAHGFGGNAKPLGGEQSALREHQVVLDHKEPPRHGSYDSRSISQLTVLAIAKHHLPLL